MNNEELLRVVSNQEKSDASPDEIVKLVCASGEPQFAYRMLEYYGRLCCELSQVQREALVEVVITEAPWKTLDESSYCHLTLANIRNIPAHLRLRLFQRMLEQSTAVDPKTPKDNPFKKERLAGGVEGCFSGLTDEEKKAMSVDVRKAVFGHLHQEIFLPILDIYYPSE